MCFIKNISYLSGQFLIRLADSMADVILYLPAISMFYFRKFLGGRNERSREKGYREKGKYLGWLFFEMVVKWGP